MRHNLDMNTWRNHFNTDNWVVKNMNLFLPSSLETYNTNGNSLHTTCQKKKKMEASRRAGGNVPPTNVRWQAAISLELTNCIFKQRLAEGLWGWVLLTPQKCSISFQTCCPPSVFSNLLSSSNRMEMCDRARREGGKGRRRGWKREN